MADIYGYIEDNGGVAIRVFDGSWLDILQGVIMSLESGSNLGLLVHGNQGEAHYDEFMRFLRGVDALVMPVVADKDLSTPPGSPSNGDKYIVASGATGAWSGKENKIAVYSTKLTAWEFFTPKAGWNLYVADEGKFYYYTGSAWAELVTGGSGGASVLQVQFFS